MTSSEPPRRLLAFAIELTVMSMVCPGLTNAGMTACTDTAATFLSCGVTFEGTDHAHLREHVGERLDGERRLAGLIAGAVEPDHQAVADELVGAHALHLRHVLDALGVREARPPAERGATVTAASIELLHGCLQNGENTELKNRVSQPMRLALSMTPLPE